MKNILGLILLGSVSLSLSAAPCNVVLIVSDDHGREALGCYGNDVIKTPHLDALAAAGTRFTEAFCTSSSCSPSRSVILTGLQNHANGTYGLTHNFHHFACLDGTVTLPAVMKGAGYRTGRVGKMHYAPESFFPFDMSPPHDAFLRDDVTMSEACRSFISETEPFFLYWCSWNPHRGGAVVESHPLKPNRFGNPPEAYEGDEEQTYGEDEVIIPPFLSDTPEVRAELAQYYQSISRMDRGVGRLIQILKDEGKYDNTLILYVSDNGAAFPGAKTTLYEPGMQLPCIVKAPDQKRTGRATDALVSWTDLMPTILDFSGIASDEYTFHGNSFRACIENDPPEDWRSEVFASHTFHEISNYYPMRVLRTKRYKFIRNIAYQLPYPTAMDLWKSAVWQAVLRDKPEQLGARGMDAYLHRPQYELYDLKNDPMELNNLADDPEYAAKVNEFMQKLESFQKDTSDPWAQKM